MLADTLPGSDFHIRYFGHKADSGTLDAHAFGFSVLGVDELLAGLASEFGVTPPSVRIKGEIFRGSVTTHYVLTLLTGATGFLKGNEDLLLATAALLEIIVRGGSFIGTTAARVKQLREAFADKLMAKAKAHEVDVKDLSAGKAGIKNTEIISQIYADALAVRNGARDDSLETIARFASSADGQRAVQRVVAPLVTGDASAIEMRFGHISTILATDDVVDLRRALGERVAAAGVVRPAPRALDEVLDSVEAEAEVLTAQLDGRKTGWRLRMNGKTVSATIYDEDFLDSVKEHTIELSGRTFKVVIRKRNSDPGSRTYDVVKIFV